jgi:hypothetical protein
MTNRISYESRDLKVGAIVGVATGAEPHSRLWVPRKFEISLSKTIFRHVNTSNLDMYKGKSPLSLALDSPH